MSKCKSRYKTKQDSDHDKIESSYSTLYRGSEQFQPQSLHDSKLDDPIELSPSTGQAELIHKTERKTPPPPKTSHPIYSSVDTNPHCLLNTAATEESKQTHDTATEKDVDVASVPPKNYPQQNDQPKQGQETLKNMYAVVYKKSKKGMHKGSAELEKSAKKNTELYTTFKTKQFEKDSTGEDKEEVPHLPLSQHKVEELYSAVKKKPKGSAAEDEVEAPPLPPHTVEELYTAVQKKPRTN